MSTVLGKKPGLTPGRAVLAVTVAATALVTSRPASSAEAQVGAQVDTRAEAQHRQHEYSLPSQPLSKALNQLAITADRQILIPPELVRGRTAPALQGQFTLDAALKRVLAGSGLSYRITAEGAVTIVAAAAAATTTSANRPQVPADEIPAAPAEDELQLIESLEVWAKSVPETSYAAPATSVGTKIPASMRETPQSVSVVTAQVIEDLGLDSLDEAVRYVPGLTLQRYDSVDTVYISRGFEIDTFQLDGQPVSFGRAQPRLAMYDRIEVLRGAAGLLNGSGDPGGVINLVRKRPDRKFDADWTMIAGSWDRYKAQADVGGPLTSGGGVRGRAVAEAEQRDEFYRSGRNEYELAYGILEFDLGLHTLLTFGGSYEWQRNRPHWTGLPLASDGSDLKLSRKTFVEPQWGNIELRTRQLFAELQHDFGAGWQFKLATQYYVDNGDYLVANRSGAIDPTDFSGASFSATSRKREYGNQSIDAALTGNFVAWGREHDLVFGANWNKVDFEAISSDFDYEFPIANIITFDPRQVPRPTEPDGMPFYGDGDTTEDGLFGVIRLRATDQLTAVLGLRYSRWDDYTRNRYYEDGVLTDTVITDFGDSHFGGYAGLVYELGAHWSAYVSYADIFRVQSERAIDNGQLPPILGQSFEAGLKSEWYDGRLNASFALFRIVQKNRAQLDLRQEFGACNGSDCYVAQGEVKSEGFESTLTGELIDGLDISAGYTYNDQTYSRDLEAQGQPFSTFTPKHIFRVWANWTLPGAASAWSVGLGVNWQDDVYSVGEYEAEEDVFVPFNIVQGDYAVWYARIGYEITDRWKVALNLDNLLDETYWETTGGIDWGNFYGSPRSGTLTLQASF